MPFVGETEEMRARNCSQISGSDLGLRLVEGREIMLKMVCGSVWTWALLESKILQFSHVYSHTFKSVSV